MRKTRDRMRPPPPPPVMYEQVVMNYTSQHVRCRRCRCILTDLKIEKDLHDEFHDKIEELAKLAQRADYNSGIFTNKLA